MGFDKEDVRSQAATRWPEIAAAFGISEDYLTSKHGPCPKCGGTDRWRVFDDFEQTGGAICNKCLPECGDGFELIAWWTGKKFHEVVDEVAVHLGMDPARNAKKGAVQKEKHNPHEQVKISPWRDQLVPLFFVKNKGITERGLKLSGCLQGKLASSHKAVMLFKVFDYDLVSLTGYVAMSLMSPTLSKWNPKEKVFEPVRKLNVKGTTSGLVGEESLKLIAAGGIVDTIWKVEGPTDLAALISVIPEDQWGKHVVVTSPSGCKEKPKWMAQFLCQARTVNVVGDRDIPGQSGANEWIEDIIACGGSAQRIDLPYKLEETKGKDLRDFLLEHGSIGWNKLLDLAEKASQTTEATATSGGLPRKYQDCLDALGLDVLCEDESGIYVYSTTTRKTDRIGNDTAKLSHQNIIRIVGLIGDAMVSQSKEDDEKISIKLVRNSIALAASGRRVNDAQGAMREIGIYKGSDSESDCVVACNGSHLSVYDEFGNWRKVDRPRHGDLLFRFDGKSWYDHDQIGQLIHRAKTDRDWVRYQWENLRAMIDRWTWRNQATDPTLLTALIGATWIQDLWRYRPQVSLRGPSNAGKSQFCAFLFGGENKEPGLFGDLAFCRAIPSAAGIRQAVGKSSRVICIDEFDSLHPRAKSDIVKIIRTAGPGDTITLGSASHKAIEFGLKAICWVSGVMVGLEEQMDSNRFLPFDLEKPPKARWDAWRAPTLQEKQDSSRAIMAISIAYGLQAAAMAQNLHQKIVSPIHDRIIEGLAGAATLWALSLGGTEADALELLQGFVDAITAQAVREVAEETHYDLFDSIMSSTINFAGQMQVTVGTILDPNGDYCDTTSEYRRQLQSQLGLSIVKHAGEQFLAIHHPTVAKKLQKAATDVGQLLRRIHGAADATVKMAATTRRCILVPWGFVAERAYGETDAICEPASF